MFALARRSRPIFSRQQSQRTTRRGRSTPSPSDFQPVSSQRGQDMLGAASGLVLSVQVPAQTFGVPKLDLRARLELPHTLPRKMKIVTNLLECPRLIIAQAETQPHDLLLLAIEVAHRLSQIVEAPLFDHGLVDRDIVCRQRVAELACALVASVGPGGLAERSIGQPASKRGE